MPPEQAARERFLARTPPFAGLPTGEIRAFAAAMHSERFEPGETIFHEGQRARTAWLAYSGWVTIQIYFGRARVLQVESLGAGQTFGLFCRFGARRETYPCTAVADGPMVGLAFTHASFRRLFELYPSVARGSFELCAQRLDVMRTAAALAREGAERRVVETLLRASRSRGPRLALTRRELAAQVGSTVETVFRVLAGLRRRGLVRTERGQVVVVAPAGLEKLASRRL